MKRLAFVVLLAIPLVVAVACTDEGGTNTLPLGSDGGLLSAGARGAVAALRDAPVANVGGSPYS